MNKIKELFNKTIDYIKNDTLDFISIVLLLGLMVAVFIESGIFTGLAILIAYALIGQNFKLREDIVNLLGETLGINEDN